MKSVVRDAFLRQTTKWPLRERNTQVPTSGPLSDYNTEGQSGLDEIFAYDKDVPIYSSTTQRMNQNQNEAEDFEEIALSYPPAQPTGDAENPKISFKPKKRWRLFSSGTQEIPEAFQDLQLRSYFFSKVIGVKSIEFFLLSLIICIFQQYREEFLGADFLIDNHTYMYVPFIVWLIFQVLVRFLCIRCRVPIFFLILGHVFIMICSALFCTSIALAHNTEAILISSIVITSSLGFMALTPFLVSIDVFKLKMFGLALLGVVVTSLCLLMTPLVSKMNTAVLQEWLPGVGMAQLFIMVCLFETQLIMKGSRFKIDPSDWLYAALYV